MPRGWNGDLVSRRMTVPSVVTPVRWSSFFTTATRVPTGTADRIVPCSLVLLPPGVLLGADDRKDLLRPEPSRVSGWPGRCHAKAPTGGCDFPGSLVEFAGRLVASESSGLLRIESEECDRAAHVLASPREKSLRFLRRVSDALECTPSAIGNANKSRLYCHLPRALQLIPNHVDVHRDATT